MSYMGKGNESKFKKYMRENNSKHQNYIFIIMILFPVILIIRLFLWSLF